MAKYRNKKQLQFTPIVGDNTTSDISSIYSSGYVVRKVKKSREIGYINFSFGIQIFSKLLFVFITVALIFLLYNKSFDVYNFASNLLQQDFAPFDYEQFVQLVDDSFSSLPSWMSGLKGISQVLVSIGYTFFWFFGLLKYLITIP